MPNQAESKYVVRPDSLRVRDMPTNLRPREEFKRVGAENVSDAVLLALILRTGTRGLNVIEVAQQLLAAFGSLTALARASVTELQAINSIGPVKAQMVKAAMELAQRLTRENIGENPIVETPTQAAAVLRERARVLKTEVFWVLMLNTKNRLIDEPQKISEGTLNSSLVHPREVFAKAIECRSAGIILAHNHPSGDTTPSSQDIKTTKELVAAGEIMHIKVLDHIIIGHRNPNTGIDFLSLRESGLITF